MMKGVILGISPSARLIDLTHQIRPQNIGQAAFVLGASYRFFLADAIHVVVVDPGVGTDRMALLLVTPHGKFLAPDNGVLSRVVRDYLDDPPEQAGEVAVPESLTAYSLTNPQVLASPGQPDLSRPGYFRPRCGPPVVGGLSRGVGQAGGPRMLAAVTAPRPPGRRYPRRGYQRRPFRQPGHQHTRRYAGGDVFHRPEHPGLEYQRPKPDLLRRPAACRGRAGGFGGQPRIFGSSRPGRERGSAAGR